MVQLFLRIDRKDADAPNSVPDRGFVLLAVLLFTGLVAAIALNLELLSLSSRRNSNAEFIQEQTNAVLDSALTRSIYALEQTSDPLIAAARSSAGYATWHYDRLDVAIVISSESGKIDLNTAPIDLIESAARIALGTGDISSRALARIAGERQSGQTFALVEAALTPADRFGPEAARFRQDFTVFSGQPGIDSLDAPDDVLRAIPGVTDAEVGTLLTARVENSLSPANSVINRLRQYFAPERPIYTITATLLGPVNHAIRATTVIVSQNQHRARVLMWHDVLQPVNPAAGSS